MEPIGIFALAATQAEWLTVRQSVVANNIANVNTPGFRAQDVTPFDEVLAASSSGSATGNLNLVTTNSKHLSMGGTTSGEVAQKEESGLAVSASGNSVAVAHELMKATEIRQDYDLNTGLVKALNKMMLLNVRK